MSALPSASVGLVPLPLPRGAGRSAATRLRSALAFACTLALTSVAMLGAVGAPLANASPPVAPTEALTPAEQRAKFKLPPGFEIQLVAAEPEIQKPMNLAFDARGRLWVTHSIEYPFAAPDDRPARDGLTVLSGFGADGRATRVERFAEGLNIPIGVLPLGAGRTAIAWSIPHLWKLEDTDGDGRADRKEPLFGPFDIADTHGNQNALRRGLDGWIYACHGFRNHSKVKRHGEGPVLLEMQSGNTYRFRPDGSAIEQVTWGQVNPFGMSVDERGDWFNADCHSKPLTLLLRGAYYESFGKPHDGLGYAPPVTAHDHGSTGIAGVAYYGADQFPADYSGALFVGNVITNLVHLDRPQWRGSSPQVAAPETFLECEDPWFRPVDLQIGPDGALYIADFYNCIIGHYEVDLKHPRRDRERGRIWRVVWKGLDGARVATSPPADLTAADDDRLFELLDAPNWNLRQQAFAWWIDKAGADAVSQALETRSSARPLTARQQVFADWAALRAAPALLDRPARRPAPDSTAVVHRLRTLGELPRWTADQADWVREQLQGPEPFARRAAAQALGRHPSPDHVPALLAQAARADDDVQLAHAVRIALRDQLRSPDAFDALRLDDLSADDRSRLADIALAIPTDGAAWFALRHAAADRLTADLLRRGLTNVVRYGDSARLDEAARFVQTKVGERAALESPALAGIVQGLRQRTERLPADSPLAQWAAAAVARRLDPRSSRRPDWTALPLDASAAPPAAPPWGVRQRKCADGREIPVFDSIVGGESLTGVLRSAPFPLPAQLEFWLCGHNGAPGSTPEPVNHVRLRLVDDDRIVARQTPPRNDVAQLVRWDLREWEGRQAVFEAVDANTEGAYAWLGFGRFQPEVVAEPTVGWNSASAELETGLALVELLRLSEQAPQAERLLAAGAEPLAVRQAALSALWALAPDAAVPVAGRVLSVGDVPAPLRVRAAELLGGRAEASVRATLVASLTGAPGDLQQAIALALASRPEGAAALLESTAQGKASARLLQDRAVVERLRATGVADLDARLETLTRHLPAPDQRIRQLIAARRAGWDASRPQPDAGAAAFKKHCAACHKLEGQGGLVGPQLDGIGQRGPDRLLEDLLDPNRNVDAAFRTTTVATDDGAVRTGLKLREEGGQWVLADAQGKEFRIAADSIESSRPSPLSLMPANLVESLPAAELNALLHYLLQQRSAPKHSK